MLCELHCPCGHRQPIEPERLKARARCEKCGKTLQFKPPSGKVEPRWLTVGGERGPARLAVPLPIGEALTVGRHPRSWLTLPGEEVAETNTELILKDDLRLHVRNVDKGAQTWINKARVLSGVATEGDLLRIGPFHLRMCDPAVLSLDGIEPEVILEESPPEEEATPRARRKAPPPTEEDLTAESPSRSPVLKRVSVLTLLVGSLGYMAWWALWPRSSAEMPTGTVYTCPVDGTVMRGEWAGGPPRCSQCGALCLGSLRYKMESRDQGPAASAPADASQKPTKKKQGPRGSRRKATSRKAM